MSAVGTLVSWSSGDIIPDAGINSNFADLKTAINTAWFHDTAISNDMEIADGL